MIRDGRNGGGSRSSVEKVRWGMGGGAELAVGDKLEG